MCDDFNNEVDTFDLTQREKIMLNELVKCHQLNKNISFNYCLNFDILKSAISFLVLLQREKNEKGPYLIVTDQPKEWYKKVKYYSELRTTLYVNDNENKREKIKSSNLEKDDQNTDNDNVIILTPTILSSDKNDLSKNYYQLAIINTLNVCKVYQDISFLKIHRKIFLLQNDLTPHAEEINDLFNLFNIDEINNKLPQKSIEIIQDSINAIQPSVQKMLKHGIQSFVMPPVLHINCPLSEIQKKVCRMVLSKDIKSQKVAIQNILNLSSHPFGILGVEYKLKAPDFIKSSTKLMVLEKIIKESQKKFQKLIIITQFNTNLNFIIDLLETLDYPYVNISNPFEESVSDEGNIYLYNPRFESATIPVNVLNWVVIFDGETSLWTSIVDKYRSSRNHVFHVNTVYQLDCQDCCENELVKVSMNNVFNDKQIDSILRICMINSHSNYVNESIDELIDNAQEKIPSLSLKNKIIKNIDSKTFWESIEPEIIEETEPPLSETNHNWTIHERNQLYRGLFNIGFSRWETIQKESSLYIDINTIQFAARALIIKILAYVPTNSFKTVRNFVSSNDPDEYLKFIDSSVFGEKSFLEKLKKYAQQLLKRLEILFNLHSSLGDVKSNSIQIPYLRPTGQILKDWWTEDYDRALCYITWKYGLGTYDKQSEFSNNQLSNMFNNFLEKIDEKKLLERAIKLCEAAKHTGVSDDKVIDEISKIPYEKWSQDEKAKIISYILQFGIIEKSDGEIDYEAILQGCKISRSIDDVKHYIENLHELCDKPDTENGISYNCALLITQRIKAMNKLRSIFKQNENNLIEFFTNVPHWRNVKKKLTPELESLYFQLLLEKGFSSLNENVSEKEFSEFFENSEIPSNLVSPYAVVKRIDVLFNTDPTPKKSTNKGSQQKKSKGKAKGNSNMISISELKALKGDVEYPIEIKSNNYILDIGHVVYDRSGFHTPRYIYPAGFKSMHYYPSFHDPDERVRYISEIADEGDDTPVFKVYIEGDDTVFQADSPSAPWVQILKKISAKRKEKRANAISGPEAFLLTSPITTFLIQNLPNAKKCSNYVFKKF